MSTKPSNPLNPKDAIGLAKWRVISTVPFTVLWELGVALLEGAAKYGRHNYRVAGVRSSVYVDAAIGHIGQWWEGEDIDADSGLSHITKAIASLTVLRDAMIQDMLNDDRPPKANLDLVRGEMQKTVDSLRKRYQDPVAPFTALGEMDAKFPEPVQKTNRTWPTQDNVKEVVREYLGKKGSAQPGYAHRVEQVKELLYFFRADSVKDLATREQRELFIAEIRALSS